MVEKSRGAAGCTAPAGGEDPQLITLGGFEFDDVPAGFGEEFGGVGGGDAAGDFEGAGHSLLDGRRG